MMLDALKNFIRKEERKDRFGIFVVCELSSLTTGKKTRSPVAKSIHITKGAIWVGDSSVPWALKERSGWKKGKHSYDMATITPTR